jgi:hypothetical protein
VHETGARCLRPPGTLQQFSWVVEYHVIISGTDDNLLMRCFNCSEMHDKVQPQVVYDLVFVLRNPASSQRPSCRNALHKRGPLCGPVLPCMDEILCKASAQSPTPYFYVRATFHSPRPVDICQPTHPLLLQSHRIQYVCNPVD